MKRRRLQIVAIVFGILAGATLAVPQEQLSGEALVEALRQGGYTIYFRHAATDWRRDDHVAAAGDWTSCDPEKMRQLTEEGRGTARAIGNAIRKLGIPVGRVLSSEYCRTRETARHLDLGPVEPVRAIMNMRAAAFVGGREAVVDRARRVIAGPPPASPNTVIVAHGNLMRAVSGAYTGEAGAVVFKPRGEGRLHVVAEIAPGEWERLARRYAGP